MDRLKRNFYIALIAFTAFSCGLNEGGVRVTNGIEQYAIEYMKDKQLLHANEEVLAYYDYTIILDGTESVILTDKRLIYHNAQTETKYVLLSDISHVDHIKDPLIGDIIRVKSTSGKQFKVAIAPFNEGYVFLDILRKKVPVSERT